MVDFDCNIIEFSIHRDFNKNYRYAIITDKKLIHESQMQSMQSKLDQCNSGNQDAVIIRKELDSCRYELTEEHNSKEQLSLNLINAKGNTKTLEDENEVLQIQLNSEKEENENLRNRIRQLKNENIRIQSELSQNQREMANKVRDLTNENQGLRNSLDTDQRKPILDCEGPIVAPPVATIPPVQPAPIIYIVAIAYGDGSRDLFLHVESFYNEMIDRTANMEVRPEFRLVHRAAGKDLTEQSEPEWSTRSHLGRSQNRQEPESTNYRKPYTCEDDGIKKNGYSVTNIAACNRKYGSFELCFRTLVPDSANVICVGNAYHAMYEDLARESDRVALQFSVHPFSNQKRSRLRSEDVYKFSKPGAMSYKQLLVECNKDTTFADSALIITNAEWKYNAEWNYNGKTLSGPFWAGSLNRTLGNAWSELNKCALSKAQNAPGEYTGLPANCINYLSWRQPENALTDVEKRKECPMIPNFGKSRISINLPVLIAEQFYNTLTQVLFSVE